MRNSTRRCAFLLLPGITVCCLATAQSQVGAPGIANGAAGTTGGTKTDTATHIVTRALPPDIQTYARTIGSRLTAKGTEQSTLTGTYTDKEGAVPLTLVWQNPGKVQVKIQSPSPTVLTYDGSSDVAKSRESLSAIQQDLLETLTDDYPDSFFFNLRNAAYRFLGARFRMDDGKSPNYKGPYYDICQKIGRVPSRETSNQKLYYFDSGTGLLSFVKYQTGGGKSGMPVEVIFSDWKATNGQYTPGSIVRKVNGVTEFTINLGSPRLAEAGSNSIFNTK